MLNLETERDALWATDPRWRPSGRQISEQRPPTATATKNSLLVDPPTALASISRIAITLGIALIFGLGFSAMYVT
jgi:hypothetical protein